MPGLRARMLTGNFVAAVIVVVIAGAVNVAVASAVRAQEVTCQGKVPTVVGPTEDGYTTGTEGADVIVAPIGGQRWVEGLGGDDTICLVDDGNPGHGDVPRVSVDAGAGADSVVNDTAGTRGELWVELGAGADHYLGDDDLAYVFGSESEITSGNDADPDVIETGGGHDVIYSGSSAPGYANQDVISTGPSRDNITYWGAAGGTLDNGPDADWLFLMDHWAGELTVDNLTGRASLGDQTMLTWTAVDGLALSAVPGSYVSFFGSDAAEAILIDGTVHDVTAPTSLSTGGGDDKVYLYDYLPTRVDTGEGDDYLKFVACDRATIALASSARCTTHDHREVETSLAGIDSLLAWPPTSLILRGTPRADRLWAYGPDVLVRSGRGADRVNTLGRTAKVMGGRGHDKLAAASRRGGTVIGGPGSDVLRGARGPDVLIGGTGRDTAYGRPGRDRCAAEVRYGCELGNLQAVHQSAVARHHLAEQHAGRARQPADRALTLCAALRLHRLAFAPCVGDGVTFGVHGCARDAMESLARGTLECSRGHEEAGESPAQSRYCDIARAPHEMDGGPSMEPDPSVRQPPHRAGTQDP